VAVGGPQSDQEGGKIAETFSWPMSGAAIAVGSGSQEPGSLGVVPAKGHRPSRDFLAGCRAAEKPKLQEQGSGEAGGKGDMVQKGRRDSGAKHISRLGQRRLRGPPGRRHAGKAQKVGGKRGG